MTPFENETIYVAGHNGMVGSAVCRKLTEKGVGRIVTAGHQQLDLVDQQAVRAFFAVHRIDRVVVAAARVGGIHANDTYPAEFLYDNLMIEANILHEAFRAGVKHLLLLGSSCIYPKHAPQPMVEASLLTGPLEPTNQAYAIAKIAGIHMCEAYNRQYGTAYRAVMPTNLYGPNDNYDLESSHVLPALIRKFHLAKCATEGDWEAVHRDEDRYGPIPEDVRAMLQGGSDASGAPVVRLWGTGSPYREFLHADDAAGACLFVMVMPPETFAEATGEHGLPFLNVGSGEDRTIRELADLIARVVGYRGEVFWDADRPDGTPRKLLDVSKLRDFGWEPSIGLEQGIRETYREYLS